MKGIRDDGVLVEGSVRSTPYTSEQWLTGSSHCCIAKPDDWIHASASARLAKGQTVRQSDSETQPDGQTQRRRGLKD